MGAEPKRLDLLWYAVCVIVLTGITLEGQVMCRYAV